MARYGEEITKQYMARIRSILVQNSGATILLVQKALESDPVDPIHLDKNYIGKLIRKIRAERTMRIEYNTIAVALAKYEDEADEARNQLWAFINDQGIETSDKIQAIRALRDISNELFEKMFDAGIFERQLGRMKTENALSAQEKDMVDKALNYVLGYKEHRKNKVAASAQAGSA